MHSGLKLVILRSHLKDTKQLHLLNWIEHFKNFDDLKKYTRLSEINDILWEIETRRGPHRCA